MVPRAMALLSEMTLASTTWQAFGDYFEETLSNDELPEAEMYEKLVDGFYGRCRGREARRLGPHYFRDHVVRLHNKAIQPTGEDASG